jgi:hypothetical protein
MVDYKDIYSLKVKLDKLKDKLYSESKSWEDKELANKYLNQAIDYVNELQLY